MYNSPPSPNKTESIKIDKKISSFQFLRANAYVIEYVVASTSTQRDCYTHTHKDKLNAVVIDVVDNIIIPPHNRRAHTDDDTPKVIIVIFIAAICRNCLCTLEQAPSSNTWRRVCEPASRMVYSPRHMTEALRTDRIASTNDVYTKHTAAQ